MTYVNSRILKIVVSTLSLPKRREKWEDRETDAQPDIPSVLLEHQQWMTPKKNSKRDNFRRVFIKTSAGHGECHRYCGKKMIPHTGETFFVLHRPEIKLECRQCKGLRFFECTEDTANSRLYSDDMCKAFMSYVCRNCRKDYKCFAVTFQVPNLVMTSADVYKIGEFPPFGPSTPARLITLIGPDRELFLKGRRSENQGLGIGAFAYYRRVVEKQKNRLLDEILKVCEQLGTHNELRKELDAAKKETQFSRASDDIKHALPDSLMIQGHNPLQLLHKPLSVGIHELSDEKCLELASSIREVLAALSERMGELLKDQKDLGAAISHLTQLNQSNEVQQKKRETK